MPFATSLGRRAVRFFPLFDHRQHHRLQFAAARAGAHILSWPIDRGARTHTRAIGGTSQTFTFSPPVQLNQGKTGPSFGPELRGSVDVTRRNPRLSRRRSTNIPGFSGVILTLLRKGQNLALSARSSSAVYPRPDCSSRLVRHQLRRINTVPPMLAAVRIRHDRQRVLERLFAKTLYVNADGAISSSHISAENVAQFRTAGLDGPPLSPSTRATAPSR